jgi:hypothetical protein
LRRTEELAALVFVIGIPADRVAFLALASIPGIDRLAWFFGKRAISAREWR